MSTRCCCGRRMAYIAPETVCCKTRCLLMVTGFIIRSASLAGWPHVSTQSIEAGMTVPASTLSDPSWCWGPCRSCNPRIQQIGKGIQFSIRIKWLKACCDGHFRTLQLTTTASTCYATPWYCQLPYLRIWTCPQSHITLTYLQWGWGPRTFSPSRPEYFCITMMQMPRKTWSACVRNDMTVCNLDGVNPLDRNSWRTSVRRCQVLPTPESGTTAAP